MLMFFAILFCINSCISIYTLRTVKIADFLDEDDTEDYIKTCSEIQSKDYFYFFIISLVLFLLCFSVRKFEILIPTIPLLSSIFLIDIRMKGIPLCLNISLFVSNLLLLVSTGNSELIRNGLCYAIFMYTVYIIIILLSAGMGGGDALLSSGIALTLTMEQIPRLLIYPFFIGGVVAIFLKLLKSKDKSYMFPFAPCILIGIFFVLI